MKQNENYAFSKPFSGNNDEVMSEEKFYFLNQMGMGGNNENYDYRTLIFLSVYSLNKFASHQVSLEEKSFISQKMLKNMHTHTHTCLYVTFQHYNLGSVTGKLGEVTCTLGHL